MGDQGTLEAMVTAPPAWSHRRVLVTGATGLLGAWVVRALQDHGAEVVALVRDRVPQAHLWTLADNETLTCVSGALEDFPLLVRSLNEYEIDTVFHLGAQTIVPIANQSPLSTFEANIRGTWHMLEAARLTPSVRALIVASSDKAYGQGATLPYDEGAALQGRFPYDVSKSCADLLAQAFHDTYGLPVCVTRCGNLYGPGDLNFSRLVPGTIRSLLRGEQPVIRSSGSLVRDYFYVKDAAAAYLALAAHMHDRGVRGEAFNFSNETPLSVIDLVAHIARIMGTDVEPVILGCDEGEIPHQYLSTAKARHRLGWRAAYSLEDGLAETVAWYREYLTGAVTAVGAPRRPT